jgi:RimJ/RimL family protein N-acetyltransferase
MRETVTRTTSVAYCAPMAERTGVVLETDRLLLRAWLDSDRVPFAEMNADPEVMAYFPRQLTREESDTLVDRFETERIERGFCPWAVEMCQTGEFAGFVGLHQLADYLPFAPGVEVGWRLARRFWGNGIATEAARACVDFAFNSLGLTEIVAMTSVINVRSRRVMERLGMSYDASDDFEHPHVPPGALRAHVLYRIRSSGSTISDT